VSLLGVDPQGRWHLAGAEMLPETALDGPQVSLPAIAGQQTLVSVENGAPAGRLDVVIPMIHGTGGEDGSLQGLLELAGLPYVGAEVLGSALQMDKEVARRLLRAEGIPVVPSISLRAHQLRGDADALVARAVGELGLPLFVKPARLGSSVGIHKVQQQAELLPALEDAARYDAKLLIERAIDAREIEVGVIGNEQPEASVPGEIRPKRGFYDYEAKYVDDATELLVPAPLSASETATAQRLALDAYRILEGGGLARVDFLLERGTGQFYVSELNSLPGFTEVSMFPRLWQASGLSYSALLDRLIELALARHSAKAQLETTYRRG
jgi:D-alanine-D-alanine ligase